MQDNTLCQESKYFFDDCFKKLSTLGCYLSINQLYSFIFLTKNYQKIKLYKKINTKMSGKFIKK